MTEGRIVRWLKQVGDRIAEDDALLLVETDSAETEVLAQADGVLIEILAAADAVVPVGNAIARLAATDSVEAVATTVQTDMTSRIALPPTNAPIQTSSPVRGKALSIPAASEDGISVEVIDPRTLFPLDTQTIFDSIRKTHRVIVVHEAAKRGGWGGDLAATIVEELFDELDAPILRVAAHDTPIPFAPIMEDFVIPSYQQHSHTITRDF